MRAKSVILLGFLAFSLACALANGIELEGLDGSDQVERSLAGDAQNPAQCKEQCIAQEEAQPAKPRAAVRPPQKAAPPSFFTLLGTAPARPTHYYLEAAAIVMAIVYVVVAWWGNRANSAIAEAFARTYCVGEHSLFPRQFAMCGAGEVNELGYRTPILKDSTCCFKFYASGRRHCEGCLATIQLICRADMLDYVMKLFLPSEDLVEVEVFMNEASMPPTVMAIGTPRQAKALAGREDVKSLARPVKAGGGDFPSKKLQVLAEHAGLLSELLADPRVADVFSSPQHLRLFRSLLVTSEAGGPNKRLLRLVVALPDKDDMKALTPLLNMLMAAIDIVGSFKLSPELKEKAVKARSKMEADGSEEDEVKKRRLEALQRRKVEKAQEEKERLARMAPEARRKAEEKLAAKAAKRSMRLKMVRQ